MSKENTGVKTTEKTKKQVVKKNVEEGDFCVYLGPTIVGALQCGTVFLGTKDEVVKRLSDVLEKYPLAKSLIVTGENVARDRVKVKTPGNILYVNYHKMIAGRK